MTLTFDLLTSKLQSCLSLPFWHLYRKSVFTMTIKLPFLYVSHTCTYRPYPMCTMMTLTYDLIMIRHLFFVHIITYMKFICQEMWKLPPCMWLTDTLHLKCARMTLNRMTLNYDLKILGAFSCPKSLKPWYQDTQMLPPSIWLTDILHSMHIRVTLTFDLLALKWNLAIPVNLQFTQLWRLKKPSYCVTPVLADRQMD